MNPASLPPAALGPVSAIAFDLDGTLVDTAPGVLAALTAACAASGVEPAAPLDRRLIGPPLPDIARALAGDGDSELRRRLTLDFQRLYDERYCVEAEPFAGIGELLAALAGRWPLYLATNKRRRPTERILAHLGWRPRFAAVFCPDDGPTPVPSKTALLARLAATLPWPPGECPYLGDLPADAAAARANGMPCLLFRHGYGYFSADAAGGDAAAGALTVAEAARRLGLDDFPR